MEKIEYIKSVAADQIWYREGTVFHFEQQTKLAFFLLKPKMVTKMRAKDAVVAYAQSVGLTLDIGRKMDELQVAFSDYLARKKTHYATLGYSTTHVNVPNHDSFGVISFDDSNGANFYGTDTSKKQIIKVEAKFDG